MISHDFYLFVHMVKTWIWGLLCELVLCWHVVSSITGEKQAERQKSAPSGGKVGRVVKDKFSGKPSSHKDRVRGAESAMSPSEAADPSSCGSGLRGDERNKSSGKAADPFHRGNPSSRGDSSSCGSGLRGEEKNRFSGKVANPSSRGDSSSSDDSSSHGNPSSCVTPLAQYLLQLWEGKRGTGYVARLPTPPVVVTPPAIVSPLAQYFLKPWEGKKGTGFLARLPTPPVVVTPPAVRVEWEGKRGISPLARLLTPPSPETEVLRVTQREVCVCVCVLMITSLSAREICKRVSLAKFEPRRYVLLEYSSICNWVTDCVFICVDSECLLGRCEHCRAVNMVQCSKCYRWWHCVCAGLAVAKQEAFTIRLSAACVTLYDVFTSWRWNFHWCLLICTSNIVTFIDVYWSVVQIMSHPNT